MDRKTALGAFLCLCIIVGSIVVIAITLMPIDKSAVCGPMIDAARQQANFYCVCSQPIEWP